MLRSCPPICDFTWTIAEASTVPTTRSSVGTDSCVACAAETGTTGGPKPPFFASVFWLQAASASRHTTDIRIAKYRLETSTRKLQQLDQSGEKKVSLFLRSLTNPEAPRTAGASRSKSIRRLLLRVHDRFVGRSAVHRIHFRPGRRGDAAAQQRVAGAMHPRVQASAHGVQIAFGGTVGGQVALLARVEDQIVQLFFGQRPLPPAG